MEWLKKAKRSGLLGEAQKTMQQIDDEKASGYRESFSSNIDYKRADKEADASREEDRLRRRKLRDEQ